MEFFSLATLLVVVFVVFRSKDERTRIALLGSHLGRFQLEKLMETLTEGYMRALGEKEPGRRAQVFQQMQSSEEKLCAQFDALAASFSKVDEADARVSTIAFGLPMATRLFPAATFDMRKLLALHARAIRDAAENHAGRSDRDKAFTLSAELFLMQHSCHWFCKSRTVASARLLVRHKTSYEQVVESIAPATRRAYDELTHRA